MRLQGADLNLMDVPLRFVCRSEACAGPIFF